LPKKGIFPIFCFVARRYFLVNHVFNSEFSGQLTCAFIDDFLVRTAASRLAPECYSLPGPLFFAIKQFALVFTSVFLGMKKQSAEKGFPSAAALFSESIRGLNRLIKKVFHKSHLSKKDLPCQEKGCKRKDGEKSVLLINLDSIRFARPHTGSFLLFFLG
jgi:hypothetical protein